MKTEQGNNYGLPEGVIADQSIEQVFASGDLRSASDHIWRLTREHVSNYVPPNSPAFGEIVLKIATSISMNLNPSNLDKIRNPKNYVLKAVQNALENLTA
jgi:hypothetical protein